MNATKTVIYPRTPGRVFSSSIDEAGYHWRHLVARRASDFVTFRIQAGLESSRFLLIFDHRREVVDFVNRGEDGCPLDWKFSGLADIEIVSKDGCEFVNLYKPSSQEAQCVLGEEIRRRHDRNREAVIENNPAWLWRSISRRDKTTVTVRLTDASHQYTYNCQRDAFGNDVSGKIVAISNDAKVTYT